MTQSSNASSSTCRGSISDAGSRWNCTYPAHSKVFLVTHGSMNPIHVDHVKMMVEAKAFVERQGYEVVGGYIGLAPESWMKFKGLKDNDRFTDEQRAEMVRLACEEHESWLHYSSLGLCVNSAGQLASTLQKCPETEKDKRALGLGSISVQGADVAIRFDRNKGKPKNNTVVVTRQGSDYVGTLSSCGHSSSTAVREACRKGDLETLRSMVHPKVFDYLQKTSMWGGQNVEVKGEGDEKNGNKNAGREGEKIPLGKQDSERVEQEEIAHNMRISETGEAPTKTRRWKKCVGLG